MDTAHTQFGDWVTRGVETLRDELPWAYDAMTASLGARVVSLTVSGEAALVSVESGRCVVGETALREPRVWLSTSRTVVSALSRGDDTLLDAILAGRVTLRGTVDDLAAFHDALVSFFRGAVRAPGFASMLDAFHRWQTLRDDHPLQ